MIEMIDGLSNDQKSAMMSYRAAWLAFGRSTAPSDRSAAERVWTAMYAALGMPPPVVLWFDGPATATLARDAVLRHMGVSAGGGRKRHSSILASGLGENLGLMFADELWGNLSRGLLTNLRQHCSGDLLDWMRTEMEGHLENQLRQNIVSHINASIGNDPWVHPVNRLHFDLVYGSPDFFQWSLWYDLPESAWSQLWTSLTSSLGCVLDDRSRDGREIRATLRSVVGNNAAYFHSGQHASWRAFYLWPHVALRPMHSHEELRQLNWWLALSRSTGWWEPFGHAVLACERPLRQAIDAEGRLHDESGPALRFRDGWSVHALHGVRVPDYLVEHPYQDTALRQIDEQPDADLRRVMIEHFGIERYIAEAGFKLIHADDVGTLYRRRNPDGRSVAVVQVVDALREGNGSPACQYRWVDAELRPMRPNETTGEIEYGDPQAMTARNAIAATRGLRGEDFNPSVEP